MFPFIVFLFLAIPIVEIYLLIQVGQVIGAGWTILLVVLTAVIGVWLLRIQGLSTLIRAQQKLQENQLPARELLEGMALVVAGAFLLTPGFFTDTIGFLLLFPPTRMWLATAAASRMVVSSMHGQSMHGQSVHGDRVQGDRPGRPPQGNSGKRGDGNVIDGVNYHRED
jgi:UPF0716 protein FxsA